MSDRYPLGGLEDDQLLAALSALVKHENDSLSDLLAHLAELDEREVCLARGYSSLFAYCTEALGFCKSSAGRRIAAARVCRQFPEAFVRVAKGELQLSVLCALRPHLKAENASELFTACSRKSYEQVELLLAARFPKPDVRDLIRRLPAAAIDTPHIGSARTESQPIDMKSGLVSADASGAASSVELLKMHEGAQRSAARGAVKPLSVDRFSVNFTADGEFRELLEEVRALMSHAETKGDLLTVVKRGLAALRSELLKKRFGVGRTPRRVQLRKVDARVASRAPDTRVLTRTRYVAAAVAREVYVRDGGGARFALMMGDAAGSGGCCSSIT